MVGRVIQRGEGERREEKRTRKHTFRNWVLSALDFYSMYVCAPYAHSAHRGQKTVSDSLGLNMNAGNQIQIHWQSGQYSPVRQLVLQPGLRVDKAGSSEAHGAKNLGA